MLYDLYVICHNTDRHFQQYYLGENNSLHLFNKLKASKSQMWHISKKYCCRKTPISRLHNVFARNNLQMASFLANITTCKSL